MVYMHKETFDISLNTGYRQINNPEHFFEIDELIALPVQVLNRKGYFTEFCCAGHTFGALWDPDMIPMPPGARNPYAGTKDFFYEVDSFSDSYISFKEGIFLPSLPPGYNGKLLECDDGKKKFRIHKTYDGGNKISEFCAYDDKKRMEVEKSHHDNNSFYNLMREIHETMEQLYEWAYNLPDFKG